MSLKVKTIKGLSWSFASQIGKQGSNFIIGVILARLLDPKDFGLLGMATAITGFVTVFGDLGVGRTLIYKQDATEEHYSSAFWVNIGFGVLLTGLMIISAPFLAAFYKQPALKMIFIGLSANFVIVSFTIVQTSLLTKKMDFKSLTIRDITAVIISGVIGILCAVCGFGVWSLVAQTLSYTLINGILLWILSPWRPRFMFSKPAIKEMFHYSADVTGFGIFTYFARNIDYLLIGKFLGPQALGLYTLAYKLMLLPLNNVTYVITKVMFPAFSQIQKDLPKVRSTYVKMVKYISLVTFPLMCGLFVVAPEFINVVYGAKWSAVIPLIQVMCFCGMMQSVYSTTSSVFFSQGRSRQLLWISIGNCILVATSVLIGLQSGIMGVAVSYTVGQFVWVAIVQIMSNRVIQLKATDFLASLVKSVLFSSVVLFSMGLFKAAVKKQLPVPLILETMAIGMLAYGLCLYFFENKVVSQPKKYIFSRGRVAG